MSDCRYLDARWISDDHPILSNTTLRYAVGRTESTPKTEKRRVAAASRLESSMARKNTNKRRSIVQIVLPESVSVWDRHVRHRLAPHCALFTVSLSRFETWDMARRHIHRHRHALDSIHSPSPQLGCQLPCSRPHMVPECRPHRSARRTPALTSIGRSGACAPCSGQSDGRRGRGCCRTRT